MIRPITVIAKAFVNILYPIHCVGCKSPLDPLDERGICIRCANNIRRNPQPHCHVCGRSVHDEKHLCGECVKTAYEFSAARSAYLYEGTVRELIHVFKYGCGLRLRGLLSRLVIDFLKDNASLSDNIDAVTFVPLHNNRLRERGFNQSKVLAEAVASDFGIPLINGLDKIKKTPPQSELSRQKRLSNLKGSFRVRSPKETAGKRILLVDDVMTTGSTLNECSRVLRQAGAVEVRCLTMARGI
jgi:ComF family protein